MSTERQCFIIGQLFNIHAVNTANFVQNNYIALQPSL